MVCGRSRVPNPAARISAIWGAAFAKSVLLIAKKFHDFIAQLPARPRDQTDAIGQFFRRLQKRAIEADDPAPASITSRAAAR